jgi:hypothetical protein
MKRKRKCWYEIYRRDCVLCGKGTEERTRRYGRKPAANKRYHYAQFACDGHFL